MAQNTVAKTYVNAGVLLDMQLEKNKCFEWICDHWSQWELCPLFQ